MIETGIKIPFEMYPTTDGYEIVEHKESYILLLEDRLIHREKALTIPSGTSHSEVYEKGSFIDQELTLPKKHYSCTFIFYITTKKCMGGMHSIQWMYK